MNIANDNIRNRVNVNPKGNTPLTKLLPKTGNVKSIVQTIWHHSYTSCYYIENKKMHQDIEKFFSFWECNVD